MQQHHVPPCHGLQKLINMQMAGRSCPKIGLVFRVTAPDAKCSLTPEMVLVYGRNQQETGALRSDCQQDSRRAMISRMKSNLGCPLSAPRLFRKAILVPHHLPKSTAPVHQSLHRS